MAAWRPGRTNAWCNSFNRLQLRWMQQSSRLPRPTPYISIKTLDARWIRVDLQRACRKARHRPRPLRLPAARRAGSWSASPSPRSPTESASTGRLRRPQQDQRSSQPQWWILNRLEDTSRAWIRTDLVEELTPYSNREEGRDVANELERVIAMGLATAAGDSVTKTAAGSERLAVARNRNGQTHRDMLTGIHDDEYANAIDVLRRIVGNLGGDSRLP